MTVLCKVIWILCISMSILEVHSYPDDDYIPINILNNHEHDNVEKESRTTSPPNKSYGTFQCLDGSESILKKEVCNGVINCPDLSDECLCESKELEAICQKIARNTGPKNVNSDNCDVGDLMCGNGQCISLSSVCDGKQDCTDCIDEIFCTKPSSCNRIDEEKQETLYRSNQSSFNKTYTVKNEIKNDTEENINRSDESDFCNQTVDFFPDEHNILKIKFFRFYIWVIAFVAVIGNTIVIAKESKKICRLSSGSLSGSMRANHILVLNLAVADLLMGIYLFMLAIADTSLAGHFDSMMLEWCSGEPCKVMGTLVLLSSEASVLTVALLTSVRLFSVFKPIASRNSPKVWIVLMSILISWLIVFALAIVPLIQSLEYFFAKHAWIPEILFFSSETPQFETAKNFTRDVLAMVPVGQCSDITKRYLLVENAKSWYDFRQAIDCTSFSQYIDPHAVFGYYSVHSVCIPRFFVRPQCDKSWRYSITLTFVNLTSFFYVACAYMILVWKAKKTSFPGRKNKNIRSLKKSSMKNGMQAKIFRLIASNFCCWVPITIVVIIYFAGVNISENIIVFCAIVLLPINSALDPIIYSNVLSRTVKTVTRRKVIRKSSSSVSAIKHFTKSSKLPEDNNR